MRPILLILLIPFTLLCTNLGAQEKIERPNAWEGKILFTDHYLPNPDIDGGFDHTGFGIEAGYYRHLSNLIQVGIPLKVAVADMPEVSTFDNRIRLISLDAVARFRAYSEERKLVPYGFTGIGGVFESINGETNDNTYAQIPIGGGVQYRLGPWGYVTGQVEYRVTLSDLERDNLQAGIGFMWMIGKPETKPSTPKVLDVIADTDGDGIQDDKDDCPTIAGLAAFMGCPDSDGDGIADSKDKCPQQVGGLAAMGCPDLDGDGVADVDDECPDVPGSLRGCPDIDGDGVPNKDDSCPDLAGSLNGCPDRDADGIADKDDRCPDQTGTAENGGCPAAVTRDMDGDGVVDDYDACPTIAGIAANRGCPGVNAEVQQVLTNAMESVRFETGSATLKSSSYSTLDQIVQIMRDQPFNNLKIRGHTDNVGGTNSNLRLSERRAETCFKYIRDKGIVPTRITYAGYGDNRPIADNNTSEGRRQNRRVEFELYVPE